MGCKAISQDRPIELVLTPNWPTVEQACALPGPSKGTMLWMIEDDTVDTKATDSAVLVEKRSLMEFPGGPGRNHTLE
jgi:hypothetical protein